MSSPTINFFPYFSPPPPATHLPPPPPPHSVHPPPPPHPHPVGPPPKPTVPPPPPHPRPVGPAPKPQPHPIVPPPPPHRVLPPPQPHPFAPPPSHLRPPPSPLQPPPSPDHHHPTVIIIIFVSCGGLFFLAFMAAALFCCLKKRKKKTVHEAEIILFDEHRTIKEEIAEGPRGTEAVILTVEDDVHIEEKVKKSENVLESSNLGAKVADHHKHGHNKSAKETEILEFDEHRKIKEKIVEGPHGSEMIVLSVEDDVHIEEKMKKNEKVGDNLGAKETAGSSS